jgi:hypothetical protein
VSAHLPGAVRKIPPYAERRTVTLPARRSPDAFDRAILEHLDAGPLMKWELREALHEPETQVYRRLSALRKAKLVKLVGTQLDKRRWALTSWQEPARGTIGCNDTIAIFPKPKAPADSWWTTPQTRDAFDQATRDRWGR